MVAQLLSTRMMSGAAVCALEPWIIETKWWFCRKILQKYALFSNRTADRQIVRERLQKMPADFLSLHGSLQTNMESTRVFPNKSPWKSLSHYFALYNSFILTIVTTQSGDTWAGDVAQETQK